MRRYIALVAWLAVAACSSSSAAATPSSSPSPSVRRSPVAQAQIVPGGCGGTQMYRGGEPDWLTAAGAGNNPNFLPYAISNPATAAGFIFGYPLQVGPRASGAANKIMWVVGIPRAGNPLRITGHPQNATEPTIDQSFPADSGPGEIYPSIVDVPSAGCWHFDLAWGSNRTSVDLVYG
ncbi:MAG TPA: hypothetical protein VGV88_10820 [Candidatus Dormibacteraeota bacterium]|nr:hypothetical protein [Candidatus Dormibacteraeota bacterium]